MLSKKFFVCLLGVLSLLTVLPAESSAASHKKNHGHKQKKCKNLAEPGPNGVLDISMQNCICCSENKKQRFVTFPINTSCLNQKKMCKSFNNFDLSQYPTIINPGALTIIQDPPFNPPLPPGQSLAYPPAVVNNPLSVVGKNVVVIGGSRGNGKAVADRFFSEGANVIATSRYPNCYKKTPYPLEKCDVRIEKNVEKFFKKIIERIHKIDILVILPGVDWKGPLIEATGNDILGLLNLKVAGFQRCVHYALPYMLHSNETRVISFSSGAAYVSNTADLSVYSMSNIALERWNDALQQEIMLNKARGVFSFGPTFSLVQPAYLTTTIGLFEYYNASSLKKNSIPVESAVLSTVGDQNLTGGLQTGGPGTVVYPSPTVGEAVFRIAIAPQPGVRYSIPEDGSQTINGIPYLTLVQILNTTDPTTIVNLIVTSAAEGILSPAYLQEEKERVTADLCQP